MKYLLAFLLFLEASYTLLGQKTDEQAKQANARLSHKIEFDNKNAIDTIGDLKPRCEGDFTFTDGPLGMKAIKFSGNGEILLGEPALGDIFSMSFWFMPEPTSTSMAIVADSTGGEAQNGFRVFLNIYGTSNGSLIFESGNGTEGSSIMTEPGACKFGEWQQVAISADFPQQIAKIYINGELCSELKRQVLVSPQGGNPRGWHIGSFASDGLKRCAFKGEISGLRIYAGILSDAEVKDIFIGKLPENARHIDRYGQYIGEKWHSKIHDDSQLKMNAQQEGDKLAGITRDLERFDRFGGHKESMNFKATGFFHVEENAGRYWLISPEGGRFYLQGVDAIPYNERGYFTNVFDSDGSIRGVFEDGMPNPNEFPKAWNSNKTQVNFLTANIQREYGNDFHEAWAVRTEQRLLSWGFNSSGKWNDPFIFDRFPYILDGGFETRRIGRSIDPYDPAFPIAVEKAIKRNILPRQFDPMLLGVQFENENGWNYLTLQGVLSDTSGTLAAKLEFLRFLEKRNEDFGKLFSQPGKSPEQLLREKLPIDSISLKDSAAFITQTSVLYHRTIRDVLRKYDNNHMFWGTSNCGAQPLEWIAGSVEFVDVIALHEYDLDSIWIRNHLAKKLRDWNKPFAITEFSFTNTRRGFGRYHPEAVVDTEAERGQAFAYYVERMAANPLCVGTSYFIMADQPVVSRGHDSEAFNFGLVDVTDQPYYEMLDNVKIANARLFDIHDGKTPPNSIKPETARSKWNEFLLDSLSFGQFDSTHPQYHNNITNRFRLEFPVPPDAKTAIPVGTIDANRNGGFANVEFYLFLWSQCDNQNPGDWFKLEESSDNLVFTTTPAEFALAKKGTFNLYKMTPSKLHSDTRYLRLSFILNAYWRTWTTSLAKVVISRK